MDERVCASRRPEAAVAVNGQTSAGERILARLEDRPRSALELSSDLSIAPSIVREELDRLSIEGLVHRDANTIGGQINIDWRWRLVPHPHRVPAR
jgi:DNA-binding transcriptional ArsR family regulator